MYSRSQSGPISRNFDEIVKSSNTLLQENCLSRNSTSFDMKMISKGQFGGSQMFYSGTNEFEKVQCLLDEKNPKKSRPTSPSSYVQHQTDFQGNIFMFNF
jgi:hypothetical protein